MEEFQKYFSQTTFHHHFRQEMLKFHPYSILTGETMVGFVIHCVLKYKCSKGKCKNQVEKGLKYRLQKVAHVSVPPLTLCAFWQNISVVFYLLGNLRQRKFWSLVFEALWNWYFQFLLVSSNFRTQVYKVVPVV